MKNENQMTPETYLPITPATRIPFPCWLWPYYPTNGWIESNPTGLGNPRYSAAELLKYGYTHYCTSTTEPTGRPGKEVKEANSYFPPSTLDKWTHTSNEDLNRYFAREFWNRPIDERNNTYWHDDDKTSEDDNHEWKPLPDFCNDWPAVRKILRDSKVVVPPDFHGRDPSEICRRTMIYMLMSKNPTSEQPQSAVPTASGATGEAQAPEQIYFCKNCGHIFISPEGSQSQDGDVDVWCAKCGSNDDHWISYEQPSVPTASGTTGEALTEEQAVIIHAARLWLDFCTLHNACIRLISSVYPIGKSGNQVAVLTDLLSELKTLAEKKPISPLDLPAPASRPAVAQEGEIKTVEDWFADRDLFLRYVEDKVNPARKEQGLPTCDIKAADHLFNVIDSRRYRSKEGA